MQMMGNTYYAFKNLHDIQNWIDLFGLTDEEPIFQKRIMAIISGAILPLVALGFIKSLVDYIRPSDEEPLTSNQTAVNDQITDSVTVTNEPVNEPVNDEEEKRYIMDKEQMKSIFDRISSLRGEGKLNTPTQEDIENEPSALAFTPTIEENDDEELRKLLKNELTQEDIQKYVERSRINNKGSEDNEQNPHLLPGVRT